MSRPTGLEKLLTVDCLFGFVNVLALEKGWRGEAGLLEDNCVFYLFLSFLVNSAPEGCESLHLRVNL